MLSFTLWVKSFATLSWRDTSEHVQATTCAQGKDFLFLSPSATGSHVFYLTQLDAQAFLLIQLCFPLQIGLLILLPTVSVCVCVGCQGGPKHSFNLFNQDVGERQGLCICGGAQLRSPGERKELGRGHIFPVCLPSDPLYPPNPSPV